MSSDSSELEQSSPPAQSPRSSPPVTIAPPPPPPLRPLHPAMTPWQSDSWQQVNTFQPWLSAEADKHPAAAPGFSAFPPHPGHQSSLSAFQRPGHAPREFLTPGHRPGGFDRQLLRPQTQILRAQPEPGEVTIEKVEQPWAANVSSAAGASSEPAAGPSRPPPVPATSSASMR